MPPVKANIAEITGMLAIKVCGSPGAIVAAGNDSNNIKTPCIIEVIDAPKVRAKIIQRILSLFTILL